VRSLLLAALFVTVVGSFAHAQDPTATTATTATTAQVAPDAPAAPADPVSADEWLWLEDVTAERSLDWVRERNEQSTGELVRGSFDALQARLLAILDSNEKIPYVREIGGQYYNLWTDAANPRGLWRRTTPAEYAEAEPDWETVLDIDALGAAEGVNWVWHGVDVLEPEDRLCLLSLSRGGADADVVREFDLQRKAFVEDGFTLPEAKSSVAWRDADSLWVGTDFGPGSLTESGYPRQAKLWKRGTPLEDAELVFEGRPEDVRIGVGHDATPGFERDYLYRGITFWTNEFSLLVDGEWVRIEKPDDAKPDLHREWLLLELRSDWNVGGTTYKAGSLIAKRLAEHLAGEGEFEVLFEPSERVSLKGFAPTRRHVLLTTLDNVRSRATVLTPGPEGWTRRPLEGLPEFGELGLSAVDAAATDEYFATVTGFTTPTSLYHGTIGAGAPTLLKSTPAYFDATGLVVGQHEAVSADGTRVPYFEVRPEDLVLDGSAPTLLYAYGGFEISMTPGYNATRGAAWLERGGVFVLANIRGGGEFGPQWHQAALKEQRPRAYEDLAAVARDLVQRKVTRPETLGVMGGSNGGLLVGNMLTMYPELFGAAVCQVPLLDMRRYHLLLAGASWMGEYGDPDDPEQWSFIRGFSPYHNVVEGAHYPRTLFTTSTRDDRVHPGHARKMVARMAAQGHDVVYYENIEGGHGGAADNAQRAYLTALAYTFLWNELADVEP
jgi:prolyl oligopeptidase